MQTTEKIIPLTAQQVFDNALFGIRSQNYKISLKKEKDNCAYRGDGGSKCGIGWSIPDECYHFDFDDFLDDTSIEFIITNTENAFNKEANDKVKVLFSACNPKFLTEIQRIHDSCLWTEYKEKRARDFEESMLALALSYNLVYTPI